MKKTTFTLLLSFFAFSIFAQLNVTYKGNVQYPQGISDVWGYVTPTGTEYALVGAIDGVSVVNVSDAENPVEEFFVSGANSGWRDIKTWGEYAYIINETGDGLMVLDLSDLPNSVNAINWAPNIPGLGTLNSCHNLYIDELGYAYLVGCNLNSGGMIYVDVFTTPGSPMYVGSGPQIYAHDVYARNNKAYASEIYTGSFAIYDVTDKNDTQLLGTQTTLFEFAHNAWLSDDGNTLFTTDEEPNATVGAYDVSDPANIITLDNFQPYETLGDGVIPHNAHVWQDWVIVSYYSDGCIILDGSRPENLVEVGNFDTFIPATTGFSGAWGAYPYLPSGMILVSDRTSGLYVLEPNYVNACWLEGEITDATNGFAINGASVEIITTNVFELSTATGEYKTGFAVAGTYDVLVKKPGYEAANAEAILDNGVVTILDVELTPLVPFSISGLVVDEDTNDPVENAKVSFTNDDFTYEVETDANGNFNVSTFFGGDYDIFAGKWSYKTTLVDGQSIDENNNTLTIEIAEGYEDVFSLDLGWTINFNANSGIWERDEPIGQFVAGPDVYIAPPVDVSEDIGNHCYITGNETELFAGVLIGGNTDITSPVFDISDYDEPFLSYYTWYLNVDPNNGNPGFTDFLIKLDNGFESVYLDTISFPAFAEINWEYAEFNILDHITPTDSMTITFEAFSPLDFSEVTEAGIDFFQVWDNAVSGTSNFVDNNIKLNAYPNPSTQNFVINYKLENVTSDSKLMIYNMLGQLVEYRDLTDQSGKLQMGDVLEKGIYFAHITNGKTLSKSLKLVKQ